MQAQSTHSAGMGNEARGGIVPSIVGEAAFLACSWTWCIGMFLPVMLMRDYGAWAFVAFAVPNCVGAMLMAWWFRSREASAAFVARHAGAVKAFSLVTLAFQWFFAAWLVRAAGGISLPLLGVLAGFIAVRVLVPPTLLRDGARRGLALGVWLASCVLIAMSLREEGVSVLDRAPTPLLPAGALAPLAAICVLGFMLCPLLDATFHASRQRAPSRTGKAEFALGFGVFFFAMIAGTAFYAAPMLRATQDAGAVLGPGAASWWTFAHIAIQLAFTIGVHEAALRDPPLRESRFSPAPLIAALAGLVLGLSAGMIPVAWTSAIMANVSTHEVVYRGFMVFYALVFPAYAWLVAVPSRGGPMTLTRARLLTLGATILAGLPCCYLGFMQHRVEFLWLAVLAVLIGRVVSVRLPASDATPA